jgi:hypothetical protein
LFNDAWVLTTSIGISTTQSVFDSVTLSGTAGTPTGSVTYKLYSGTTCTGTPVFSSTVNLNPDGTVPDSDVFTPTATGTYNWQVVYSGDTNNPGGTNVCGSESVTFNSLGTAMQPAVAPGRVPTPRPTQPGR